MRKSRVIGLAIALGLLMCSAGLELDTGRSLLLLIGGAVLFLLGAINLVSRMISLAKGINKMADDMDQEKNE